MFASAEFAHKYHVNITSTSHLLYFWYLRKSTSLPYICFRFALYAKKPTFAISVYLGKDGANLFVCIILLSHLPKLQINICLCYTHGLLQGQICPLTLNLYYYQINKFKCIISNLLSVQIWPSSPNSHTYQIQKFACIFLIFTIG